MLVRELQGGHCQVPCGIFDDPAMVAGVTEDCATIRKAMEQIVELGAKKDQTATDFNQMVRWVNTKEGSLGAGVRSLGGPRVGLPLSAGDSVGRARELVEALEGTPVGAQRLLLRGVVLEDAGAPLGAYGFEEGDDLMLVRELQGGHCQVPCGIFDDPAMVAGVTEDCATIRKAMEQIVELGAKKDQTA